MKQSCLTPNLPPSPLLPSPALALCNLHLDSLTHIETRVQVAISKAKIEKVGNIQPRSCGIIYVMDVDISVKQVQSHLNYK